MAADLRDGQKERGGQLSLLHEDPGLNNLVYWSRSAILHQNSGQNNLVRNNILAFGNDGQFVRVQDENHLSFTLINNIVYFNHGSLLGGNWNGNASHHAMDVNVYYDASGHAVTFAGRTLTQWRALGMDAHSVIANPLFVNANALDFRLDPSSPALTLGFQPFPLTGFGPQ